MNRRNLLQLISLSCLPLPGLDRIAGSQERIWVAPTTDGFDSVTRRPVDFFWNTRLNLELKQHVWPHPFRTIVSGMAAYLSEDAKAPFRHRSFEPLFIGPDDRLTITWVFKMEEAHAHRSIHDPVFRPYGENTV